MTALKALLARDQWLRNFPVPGELVTLSRAIARLDGAGDAKTHEPTEVLQARIIAALDAGETLSGRDLRDACRVCLLAPRPLMREADVRLRLIQQVAQQKRRSALFAMIDSYLDGFREGDDAVSHLGGEIAALCENWPWREHDLWPELQRKYRLFDAARGPGLVAGEIITTGRSVHQVLTEAGLGSEVRRKGGVAEACFARACDITRAKKADAAIPLQERLIAWGASDGADLVFTRAWPLFAAALLEPWVNAQPGAAHEKRLLDVALRCGGDPRLQPAKWRAVEAQFPNAYAVILRWLTKASFEQFFSIVDQTVDNPLMWSQRKAFWTRYLRGGHIASAWVVFGDDGAERAMQAARRTGNEALTKFGRAIKGTGKSPQHTALIMLIGDLTIAEWSHNGKCNIWRTRDPAAPNLFKPEYSARSLMNAPSAYMHDSSGNWRYRIDEHLRLETGIRV